MSSHRTLQMVSLVAVASLGTLVAATITKSAQCNTTFTQVSASDFLARFNPGWNLGNTLDAIPTEGSWNNAPVVGTTFDTVRRAGINGVRIPVTYADHYTGGAPDWPVDAAWLARVSAVTDMVTSRGMHALVNMQHDSWKWADVTQPDANITMIHEKFYATWLQIGRALACKSSMVAFEPINEPPAKSAADGQHINEFNRLFLRALTDSGGFNARRVVTLVGGNEDIEKTIQWFKRPSANTTNPWALQFHYYSPYDFIFSAWGKTIWGSDSDKEAVIQDLRDMRGNFSDVPLLMGEYSASPANCEASARWRYTDWLLRTAQTLNISAALWDNGHDNLDRRREQWRDPTTVDIITAVTTTGVPNSLPAATTDDKATTQWTSAYVFRRMGAAVGDYHLPFVLSGHRVAHIGVLPAWTAATTWPPSWAAGHHGSANATALQARQLQPAADYAVNGSGVTLTAAFLRRYFHANAPAGSRANLSVAFSAGLATVPVEVVLWDTPTLAATTSRAIADGTDLKIPVQYRGLKRLATMKMASTNGTFLIDTWTKYLGPLQQGRTTYSNQWDYDEDHVIVTASAIQTVVDSGHPAVLSFEFFPRVPGNVVNYTLTV